VTASGGGTGGGTGSDTPSASSGCSSGPSGTSLAGLLPLRALRRRRGRSVPRGG
jgi:hypothetical protein